MVALDAGQSEIASMLYSRMNIQCSVSPDPCARGRDSELSGRGRAPAILELGRLR